MKKLLSLSTLAFVATISSSEVFACSTESYMGSICTVAFDFCPNNTLPADGRLVSIQSNTALFALLGTRFGGDGRNTFGLPDLRGRTPVGAGTGPGLHPVQLGAVRGTESETITLAQLPTHTHTATVTAGPGSAVEVQIPVSSNTSGNKTTPDSTFSYLAGTPGGSASAAMWTDTMTAPVNVKGVTTTGGASVAGVAIAATGGSQPIVTLPPQLGLNYCIVSEGIFPPRP